MSGSRPVRALVDADWTDRTHAELSRRWDGPVEVHATVPSTNERALALARSGGDAWSAIVAAEQTAGRGRRGRAWESRARLGLWMSVIVPTGSEASNALPLVAGLEVARAIEVCAERAPGGRKSVSPAASDAPLVSVKWPNDLFVERRKLGGVLCEVAAPDRVVVGIGVNLLHHEGDFGHELRGRAASVRTALGVEVQPWELAAAVLIGLRSRSTLGPLTSADLHELHSRDALRGRAVLRSGHRAGVGAGFDPDGALLLGLPDGSIERVRTGEIELAGGR